MPPQSFTVNSRKYDGGLRRSWQAYLVEKTDDWIDLVGFFQETVIHSDLGRIEKGTISRERFYLNRWYNYFVFEDPPGILRNYYINICMPPKVEDGLVDYVDLDIDLIVWPDGNIETLDMEEFEENANIFRYPPDVRKKALLTLDQVKGYITVGKLSENL